MHEGDFPKEERKRNEELFSSFPAAGSDDSIFCVPLNAGKKVGFLFFFFFWSLQ
jgi:hypothetical protein